MIIQKDTVGPTLVISIILVFGVILLGYWMVPEPVDDTPRVGDVWEHYGTGDPFIEEEVYTRRIIGVKKGFIQYIENDRDTLSRRVNVFKFNSEKILSHAHKKDSI